ncbi:MAG: flagellar brake protein [Smithella sp.]|jgi:c-di-GMP-binding flagellar brake protein YcgR
MNYKKTREVCIGLEFGTSLNVQFENIGSAKTSIIGLERGKFLIIRPPALAGIEAGLFKKNRTIVTYLYEGMVYGFRCTMIGLIKAPFPLLILSYPESAEEINLRGQKRLSCILNGQVTVDDVSLPISIQDISLSGCRLIISDVAHTPASLYAINCTITITADMENEINETVTLVATTKNIQQESNCLSIGAAFNTIDRQTDSDCMGKIKQYIAVVQKSIIF